MSTKVLILGSGTPNPDPARTGAASAVVVNGVSYLIDAGVGVVRRAAALSPTWGGEFSELEVDSLGHVFITHLHSDHTLGLADLLLTPWVMGREEPLKVFGPSGTTKMLKHLRDAYEIDIEYRTTGSQPSNISGSFFYATEITEGEIFKDDNVTVQAFEVDHGNLKNSFGYVFETSDRRIVFSGDTGVSESLKHHASGADVLIHEVYSSEGFAQKTADWQNYHQAHHTSASEIGIIARDAQPGILVLSHILFWGASVDSVLAEVREYFDGDIVIAEDYTVI